MEKQLAYIAGIFDGEGTLVIGKYPRPDTQNLGYRAYMAFSNTHVPLLQYLKSVVGGKIIHMKNGCYTLTLTTSEIRRWLPEILPFLIVKKEQAEELLTFLDRQANNSFAPVSDKLLSFYEKSYQRMKVLKKERFIFKEKLISLGIRECAQCNKKFETFSNHPKKIYCSVKCKKIVHYTRSNRRISLGIPAWNGNTALG